jgi:hypothetical protein
MDSTKQSSSRPYPPPKITFIRMQTEGPQLSLTCTQCQHCFESYFPTIGSIPVLQINCPRCQTRHTIWPEDYDPFLDLFFPSLDHTQSTQLTVEASRITETWYRLKPFADILTFKGVNLGEGAERELVGLVAQGLMECVKAEEGKLSE